MDKSICGADCTVCPDHDACRGCLATGGRPFGGDCQLAQCCKEAGVARCDDCAHACSLRETILCEVRGLGIAALSRLDTLYALRGAYCNLAYPLPNGETVKLLDDNKIYLGAQAEQADGRCCGLIADASMLVVCTYGADGTEPQLVLYKKRAPAKAAQGKESV